MQLAYAVAPAKREAEDLTQLRAVKRQHEAERLRAGVVGPEDNIPPSEAGTIKVAILARCAREEEVVAQRHHRDEEVNDVLLEQGPAKTREFEEKEATWGHEAEARDSMYIDLTSDND